MMFVRDEVARNLLSQHIRDCELGRAEDRRDRELASAEVNRKLEMQNETQRAMHEQNQARAVRSDEAANARFIKIMWGMIGLLVTMVTAMVMELLKVGHP